MLWAFSYIHIKNFFVRFDLFFRSLYIEALFIEGQERRPEVANRKRPTSKNSEKDILFIDNSKYILEISMKSN